MRKLPDFKELRNQALNGLFNLRAAPGEVSRSDFRLVLNMSMDAQNKRCRMSGWKQLGKDSPHGFLNQDLHDQLIGCTQYYESFLATYSGSTYASGQSYSQWFPGGTTPTSIVRDSEGPFCGYAPDYYGIYGTDASAINSWFISEAWCDFYPYQFIVDAGTQIMFDGYSSGTSGPGGLIGWHTDWIQDGRDYLDAVEAVNGPSQAITDARDFLDNILTPGTDDKWDPRGFFSGVDGLVTWSYTLEYEDGIWYAEYHLVGGGPGLESPCTVAGYLGCYFMLGYNSLEGGVTTAGYGYGDLIGSYTWPRDYDYIYCGDYLYTRPGYLEPVTMLNTITTEDGSRKLIAATRSRIYALNERTSNWQVLADGLGGGQECDCSARRFKSATVGAVMVFTNGYNPPMYYAFDAAVDGCALWRAKYIADLDTVGVTQARVVASWNGFMFLANVRQDGQAHPTRIFWSDFNNPTSWLPADESSAGYADLGIGEQILAIRALGGALRVYTDQAIYIGNFVGGDLGFSFQEIYRGQDSIKYPNSLVDIGDTHIYAGNEGIFALGEYDRAPIRLEWVHKASAAIYDGVASSFLRGFSGLSAFGGIDKENCEQLVGFYDGTLKNVWFSWPTHGETCPNMSLCLNLNYAQATLVDHGFNAGINYIPDYRPTFADFAYEWQICTADELAGMLIKEGEPYSPGPSSFPNPPSYIWNATEDTSLPMHPDSLAARLGDLSLEDLCESCEADVRLVAASSARADGVADRTLKEFDSNLYYRERYTGPTTSLVCPYTQPGSYALDGYYSMMQGPEQDFGNATEKLVNKIAIAFNAGAQAIPNTIRCQVGYGALPDCLAWDTSHPEINLDCLTDFDLASPPPEQRPGNTALFNFYRRGVFLSWRFYVDEATVGATGAPPTGGEVCFASFSQSDRVIKDGF